MSEELTREQVERMLDEIKTCGDPCQSCDNQTAMLLAHDAALRTALAQAQQHVELWRNTARAKDLDIANLKADLNETWVDDKGTAWNRPTAWAYAQVCRVKDELTAKLAAMEQRYREAVHEDQRTITNLQQQLASKHNFAVVKDIEVRDMPPGRLEVPSTKQQLATAQQELAQWKSMEKMDKACEAATLKECTKEEIYNWTLFFMKKHADARAAVVELAEMVIDEYECHEKSKLMLSCCLIAKDDYQRAVELKRKAQGKEGTS